MKVSGKDIQVQGRLVRIGRLDGDTFKFLDDPEVVIDGLRRVGERVDLFTFMQRLPETSPVLGYPMEWDNLAVLPITTFDYWFRKTIRCKVRNMIRKSEKHGVVVREVPFDDVLVRG